MRGFVMGNSLRKVSVSMPSDASANEELVCGEGWAVGKPSKTRGGWAQALFRRSTFPGKEASSCTCR